MRQHERLAAPPTPDLVGGTRRQRDQPVRGGDQDVELASCSSPVDVVRVAQVVDGEDEGSTALAQARATSASRSATLRASKPKCRWNTSKSLLSTQAGVEHDRRPPLLGSRGLPPAGSGSGSRMAPLPASGREVADVHVAGGDGRDHEGARVVSTQHLSISLGQMIFQLDPAQRPPSLQQRLRAVRIARTASRCRSLLRTRGSPARSQVSGLPGALATAVVFCGGGPPNPLSTLSARRRGPSPPTGWIPERRDPADLSRDER